jgi:hypothetical protein
MGIKCSEFGYPCVYGSINIGDGGGARTGAYCYKDVTDCGGASYAGRDLDTLLQWVETNQYFCFGNVRLRLFNFSSCGETIFAFNLSRNCTKESVNKYCTTNGCVRCTSSSHCGTNSWEGSLSCGTGSNLNKVMQNYRTHSCSSNGVCSSSVTLTLNLTCSGSTPYCSEGNCVTCTQSSHCSSGEVCTNNACVAEACTPSSWVNTSEYRCSEGMRQRKQNRTESCGGASIQWINDSCSSAQVCINNGECCTPQTTA